MHLTRIFTGALFSALAAVVSGLGTSCSAPLGAGTAAATDPFWMQNIKHQGTSAYNANPASYQVFRNVKVRHPHFILAPNLTGSPTGFWRQRRRRYRRYRRDQVRVKRCPASSDIFERLLIPVLALL